MPVKVKYVGGSDEVEIAALPGTRVKRNHQVEVPRNIADRLVKGGDFKRVVAKGSKVDGPGDPDEVEDDGEPDGGPEGAGVQPEGVEG